MATTHHIHIANHVSGYLRSGDGTIQSQERCQCGCWRFKYAKQSRGMWMEWESEWHQPYLR